MTYGDLGIKFTHHHNNLIIYIIFLGPRAPLLPTGITVGNVNHNSALIQWTVLSIAYSPETYYIRYGLSNNKLNYVSSSINGATDLAATSQTYSITLQHLIHNEVYYYSIVSNNNYTETTSAIDSFQTTKLCKFIA